MGLLIPLSKAGEPLPRLSLCHRSPCRQGSGKERQEDYSRVSQASGPRPSASLSSGKTTVRGARKPLAPRCRDPALSPKEEMSDHPTSFPNHSYQTLLTLPGQTPASLHTKRSGGEGQGAPPSIRGTPGGGSATKEEGQSLVVAVGALAGLSERTIFDWERLRAFSLTTPPLLALDKQGSRGKHLDSVMAVVRSPLPEHLVRPPAEGVGHRPQWKQ